MEEKNFYLYIFNININQMKRAIHIRCTQQFLYFKSHIKSLKQLHIIVCFSVSVPHLQYQHILLTRVFRRNFKKWTISGTCINNVSKIKLSINRGHITFQWIWGLTGITFSARRKSITIARKIYLRLFFTFVIRIYLIYS